MIEGASGGRISSYLAGLLVGRRLSHLGRTALGRLLSPAPGHRLLIEERIAIGPKKTLMLVSCAGRHFLVATAGDFIAPLIEVRPDGSCAGGTDASTTEREKCL